MKIKSIIIISILLVLGSNLLASNAKLFEYNSNAIVSEFANINNLEIYINKTNITYSLLKQNNSMLLAKYHLNNLVTEKPLGAMFTRDDMNWTSFAWGFCCWPVGCLFIPFNKNKDDNTKLSFFYGMLSINIIGEILAVVQFIEVSSYMFQY